MAREPLQPPSPLTGMLRFAVAVRNADLGTGASTLKALLFALASAADEDDRTTFPSQATLALWSGLAERNVPPNLAKLEALLLVTVVGRRRVASGQSVNVYRLEIERLEGMKRARARPDGASGLQQNRPDAASGLVGERPDGASGQDPMQHPRRPDGASDKHTIEHTKEHTTHKRERAGRASDHPIPLPQDLGTPELEAAWSDWQTHAWEKGKPLTPTQAGEHLNFLRGCPVHERVPVIKQAISSGWTCLFPLRKSAGAAPSQRPRPAKGAYS